jgi:hypothetical protein
MNDLTASEAKETVVFQSLLNMQLYAYYVVVLVLLQIETEINYYFMNKFVFVLVGEGVIF